MCGITGFIHRRGDASPERLDRMINSMFHRGPDGEGRFVDAPVAVGMRRLAIIDPKGGQQPFSTEDGQIVALLNGEIYNYRTLRRELEQRGVRFKTDSDTEVLPHAFRLFGPEEFARRLDGMFGIVIVDRAARRLHLFRDRYGEKPVFYSSDADRFAFASQLTTLTLEPDFDFKVDPIALRHYLFLHSVPGPRTIFESIRRLEPGCRLSVSFDGNEAPDISDWATGAKPRIEVPRRFEEAVEEVRTRLDAAVESRLIADVPVGVFLSGGLDSSAVAAVASRHVDRVRTFSVGFEDAELDESPFAKAVATHLGAEHHHFEFDLSACLSVLDEAMCALDEPLGDPACLPVLLLSKEARKHVKVVLAGEGADEFFAGYGYYPKPEGRASAEPRGLLGRLAQWATRGSGADEAMLSGGAPEAPLDSFFRADNSTPSGFPGLTNPAERDRLVPGTTSDEDDWTRGLLALLNAEPCGVRRAQEADIRTWLDADLLVKLDRMTMGASLEGRAPYLDPALAEFGLALPAHFKIDEHGRKRVLQEAASAWLPAEVRTRRKQGFVLPIQEWLVGPLRERLLDGLSGDRGDGLDAAFARDLASEDLAIGAPRARLLYGLLAYREWMRALRERRANALRFADGGTA